MTFKELVSFTVAAVVLWTIIFHQQNQISKLQLENILYQHQTSLLKDQVLDMDSQGTYDEGLADGLVRSSSKGYTDGYHAAITQLGSAHQNLVTKEDAK